MQNHHPIPRTSMHDVWLGHSAPRAGCINDATPSHQSPAILGVSRLGRGGGQHGSDHSDGLIGWTEM